MTHKEAMEAKKKEEEEAKKSQQAVDDDTEESQSDEERPDRIVQPKYKVVHSYPHDMADYWEGHRGTVEEGVLTGRDKKLPTELTVTIIAKHCESMKDAKLEINESTLLFEVPDLYYLDLNLKYKCD